MTGSTRWQGFWRSFAPQKVTMSPRERVLACLGAGLGVALTWAIALAMLGSAEPAFIAPMGASAVLLFMLPASPLAQPWSVVGGNVVAGMVAVTMATLFGHNGLAAGGSLLIAGALMLALRCLHPPSGAVVVTAVLGGPAIAAMGYRFVAGPVLVDSLVIALLAIAFNNLAGRRYPHRPEPAPHPHATRDPLPTARAGFTPADLEAALRSHGEAVDVSLDDLHDLLNRAQAYADRRHWTGLRCADLMSRDVVTLRPEDTCAQARALLAQHGLEALPVRAAGGELAGLVDARDLAAAPDLAPVHAHLRPAAQTARPGQAVADLVPWFADAGLRIVPVLDEGGALAGVVSRADLIAGLYHGGR
jgi:CBS domain-containing membrane protein